MPCGGGMTTPRAILVAAIFITAAILFAGRWSITNGANLTVYRLDRWTGDVRICAADNTKFTDNFRRNFATPLNCELKPPDIAPRAEDFSMR